MDRLVFSVFLTVILTGSPLTSQERTPRHDDLLEMPPDSVPAVFGRGVISTEDYEHSSPVFSPSHDEIYWSIRINGEYGKEIIKRVRRTGEGWSEPEIPPFSVMGMGDLYPTFSADGSEIFFTSDRPDSSISDSLKRNIWKVKKTAKGWSSPELVRFDSLDIYGLSISSEGTLYFMGQETRDRQSGSYDIYYSPMVDGGYAIPKRIGRPISTEFYEDGPFISGDGKFLLFESTRPGGYGKLDLYVSVKTADGGWGPPVNLGDKINSESSERFPRISPDGQYFFFASGRGGESNIYWVSASFISRLISDR